MEEAAAEARSQFKVPRRGDEIVAYKFPFHPIYEVKLQQMGMEARGVLLGPVVVGARRIRPVTA